MIYTAPGATFEAVSENAASGLVGTIGVRILDGQGNTTTARTTSGIIETPAGSGVYTATLTAPTTAGQYVVVWDNGGSPTLWATEQLQVTSSALPAAVTSGNDLTTLAAVRAFLQKNSGQTYQDTTIQTLITAASELINTQVARFLPAETAATKTLIWRGGPLGLHPYFLRSVSGVSYGTTNGADGTSLTASDYRLRPMPAPEGVYRWLHFPGYLTYPAPDSETEITVTGNWGFADLSSVPASVQHWTNVTVATWLRKDVAAFSTTLRLEEDRLERPAMLPTAVMAGLARYKQAGF